MPPALGVRGITLGVSGKQLALHPFREWASSSTQIWGSCPTQASGCLDVPWQDRHNPGTTPDDRPNRGNSLRRWLTAPLQRLSTAPCNANTGDPTTVRGFPRVGEPVPALTPSARG